MPPDLATASPADVDRYGLCVTSVPRTRDQLYHAARDAEARLDSHDLAQTEVGGERGGARRSVVDLDGQELVDNCPFGTQSQWCVSTVERDPGEDSQPYIGARRDWRLPGCYSWRRGDPPVKGTC